MLREKTEPDKQLTLRHPQLRRDAAALGARAQPLMKYRLACFITCFVIACDLGSSNALPPCVQAAHPEMVAEFPFGAGDSPWTVETTIQGKHYEMIIDTATGPTIFDASLRHLLGNAIATMNLNSADGPLALKGLELLESPVIELGHFRLRPPNGALSIDLKPASVAHSRLKVDGILGMDVLRGLVLTVDYDARVLRFSSARRPESGHAVPIRWTGREDPYALPVLRFTLGDGNPHDFVLDSGSNGDTLDGLYSGHLNARTYDSLLEKGMLAPVSPFYGTTGHVFGGTTRRDSAGTTRLVLGPFSHERLIFLREPGQSSLGRGYFSRYGVTFDFPRSTAFFRRSTAYSHSDFYDRSGMRIKKNRGAVEVTWVRRFGAAAIRGVAAGDIICELDGRHGSRLSELTIRQMLSTNGRHVLTVRRGKMEYRVVLDLTALHKDSRARIDVHGVDGGKSITAPGLGATP